MITRSCVRALLHDSEDRFLLMEIVEPESGRAFWITPGGGKEREETDHQALARELLEETGLTTEVSGPLVWTRDFTFSWSGGEYRALENFYWIRCEPFIAVPTKLDGEIEAGSFSALQWWSLEEIESSAAVFAPLDLGRVLRELIENGAPDTPIALGR